MQTGRRKRACVLLGIITAVLMGAFVLFDGTGLRLNLSGSVPIGFYRSTSDASQLVEFCPAEPFARMAKARGYRAAGSCPDGAAPLLKPVVAHAGDEVIVSPFGMRINGVLLSNTAALAHDTQGRSLPAWESAGYRVRPGELIVASSYNPRSFDSRYFGPIRATSVRERLKPLLTLPRAARHGSE